eukprot:GILI01002946.1.p1 GENE.GILI01002946.1~~GILI01002946.1.p1  ORF type:complete len:238 (-),score=37.08 GILI01002946.1:41-718(-)
MYSHSQLNRLQLKEQQQINRERKALDDADLQKKANMQQQQKSKFDHIRSHGYGQDAKAQVASASDDIEIKVFVNECDESRRMFTIMESSATQVDSSRTLPPIQKPKSSPSTIPPLANRGVVPEYLLKRKAEMKAEKDAIEQEVARQTEAAKYPPGHRPVTEDEKLDILDKLAQRKKELQMELHKLPVRFDTQAIRQKKLQIESEMAETEAAERKFNSKKQLFVPI